ncbi:hypothetical protein B0A48_12559 [Cryoendolithus antarcticus]|uniref:Uncharacterized protein n=1 Tax=Cryoendolithus antarcticus TaxID=1507870 RepID=A0A1V8SR76_9PEZI|nr:hypothetical protein B0A48_12559 [Cryoendolithus antarcticus]
MSVGIGKAIATGFAQAGAQSVSILGRREGRLIAAVADIRAAAINAASVVGYEVADLLKREEVDRAFQSILAQTGNIEILVCNAAVLPAVGPLSGYDADQFMNNFSINVLSTFNTLQAFLPLAPPNATIINITAAAAHIVPMPGASAYAVGKAASLKMVDYFAAENPNLHIVSMQPGTVATDMTDLPGHFCVWLASPEARFLKNKIIWANWDVDELVARSGEIENLRLLTCGLNGVPM